MIKFDERNNIIYSSNLRKILFDLIEENNYDDEVKELEIPRKPFIYKRISHLKK